MKNRFKALSDTAAQALKSENAIRYLGEFEIIESIYKGKTYYFIREEDLENENLNMGVKTWICYVGEYAWLMLAVSRYKGATRNIWNSLHSHNPKYHV